MMMFRLTNGSFFKVIRMSTKRLYLIILLLLIGCQQAGVSEDKPALPGKSAYGGPAKAELDKQLRIYKSTLMEGKSEQIRVDAATVMLFNEDPLARAMLLEALKQTENGAARVAVCKALSQTRVSQRPVSSKEDFIGPLREILTSENSAIAKLAAEATLIFEYEQVSEPLGKIATDSSLPAQARLNAIYALKLQPDVRAIFTLIELVADTESQVAAAAQKALQYWGIAPGKTPEARKRIIAGIELKGNEAFLRERLVRQADQIRGLEAERDLWRKEYLDALEKIYEVKDDSAKGKFLAEYLSSSESIVKLWALEKVSQLRVGTSELPAEFGPVLVSLVSDQDNDVRLKTAQLLSLMGELNSAEKLLEQLNAEQAEEVRTELFGALGVAVSYALLEDSQITISPQIREQTLEWAAKYLLETDAKKSQKGAEVVRKLLEQDGSTPENVGRYLGLLVERYEKEEEGGSGALRGELLSAMAGLCAQGSACKLEAEKLFGRLFQEALGDETDLVREAAVVGLIHIDSARVLKTWGKGLVNDPSDRVRERLINLAGEIGDKDDLAWLWEKTGSTAESGLAWEAMLKILKRSKAAVLAEWITKFNSLSEGRLSDEQKLRVLETAEQKAVVENQGKLLKGFREALAELYKKSGKFEQAAKYFGMLHEAAKSSEEKEAIVPDLLDAFLRWQNVEMAAKLVDNCLLGDDLGPDSKVVQSIEGCLNEPPAGVDPNAVLRDLLDKVKPVQNRPKWQEQLRSWTERLSRAKEPDRPKEVDN